MAPSVEVLTAICALSVYILVILLLALPLMHLSMVDKEIDPETGEPARFQRTPKWIKIILHFTVIAFCCYWLVRVFINHEILTDHSCRYNRELIDCGLFISNYSEEPVRVSVAVISFSLTLVISILYLRKVIFDKPKNNINKTD